ncbi:hypothetical protein Tco_0024883 [Tanacetum coccineum]
MLLAMKDEAGGNLDEEENDFMLDNAYGDDTLEELNAAIIMMTRIQTTDGKANAEPKYDAKAISEVNVLQINLISGMRSKGVHEHTNHEKLKTVINTSDDDQIDSNIIFDDPYVENNGGTDEHDSNAHDHSSDIESLIYNKLETCKERVKTLENKPVQSLNYKEAYEALERELSVEKDTIKKLQKEKDKIQGEFFQLENENVKIRYETELSKKAFKARENNWVGYQNPERLKKAIAPQPKVYDGERLQSTKLIIDSPDYEETLEDAEESRLKMKDKMIQLDYEKLNDLYEIFVPQKEIPIEKTYFSTPSTSNVSFESSIEMSDLPLKKMPNGNKMLQLFVKLDKAIGELQTKIDHTLQKDRSRTLIYDDQDVLRQIYKYGINEMLMLAKEKISNDSKDIQATMEQRIKILENDFKRAEAQYVNLDLKIQHQKKKMACDVYWKSMMTKLTNENVLLKTQVESTVQERKI